MVLNADVQFLDLPFQELQLLALQSQHPAVMRGPSSLQGKLPLRNLFAQTAAANIGELFTVWLAVRHLPQNLSSGYPRASPWPPMRSLILASSRIFCIRLATAV